MSPTNVALSNLRAVVIVIVLAFHSVLPYIAALPAEPFPFDQAPHRWLAFPIVDSQRWFGFDLFCAWQDVGLMSLMFFLSGLLTAPSLQRKGPRRYLSDRMWRIGVPFLVGVGILSPIAYYASYRVTAVDPGVPAFWGHWLSLGFWPSGPQWFLWQLCALGVLAAALWRFAPRWAGRLGELGRDCRDRPLHFLLALSGMSALVYVPLAVVWSPWTWEQFGPFSIQLSRPLHYAVYFFAGFALGYHGLDRSLLRFDGPVARHWAAWLAAALVAFGLWGGLTSLTFPDWDASPITMQIGASLAFALACATGGLSLLAACLRWLRTSRRALDSLSRHAYSMYLLHYVFVVWLQYALLESDAPAPFKAALVLTGSLALSWGASVALGKTAMAAYGLAGPQQRQARAMITNQRS